MEIGNCDVGLKKKDDDLLEQYYLKKSVEFTRWKGGWLWEDEETKEFESELQSEGDFDVALIIFVPAPCWKNVPISDGSDDSNDDQNNVRVKPRRDVYADVEARVYGSNETFRKYRKSTTTSEIEDYYSKYEAPTVDVFNKINELIAESRAAAKARKWAFPCREQYSKWLVFESNSRVGETTKPGYEPNGNVIMHIVLRDYPFFSIEEDNDGMKGKPMVILEDIEDHKREPKVIFASRVARANGVRPGFTYKQANEICPNLVVPKINFSHYTDICESFFKAILGMTVDVEVSNCDEAFIDATGLLKNAGQDSLLQFIFAVGISIHESTGGAGATFGISCNKFLARLATRQITVRKDGTNYYYLRSSYIRNFMERLAIEQLPLTRVAASIIKDHCKVVNCGELRKKSHETLQEIFGEEMGNLLYQLSKGVDTDTLRYSTLMTTHGVGMINGLTFTEPRVFEDYLLGLSNQISTKLVSSKTYAVLFVMEVNIQTLLDGGKVKRKLADMTKEVEHCQDRLELLDHIKTLWCTFQLQPDVLCGLTVKFTCHTAALPGDDVSITSNHFRDKEESLRLQDVIWSTGFIFANFRRRRPYNSNAIRSSFHLKENLFLVEAKMHQDFLTFSKSPSEQQKLSPTALPIRLGIKRKYCEPNACNFLNRDKSKDFPEVFGRTMPNLDSIAQGIAQALLNSGKSNVTEQCSSDGSGELSSMLD